MILTNKQIYDSALKLNNFNIEDKLPVKINFFLQKNIKIILEAGQEIENMRLQIINDFGKLDENTSMHIVPQENIEQANKEIKDLLSIEQDLNIHIFKLDDFADIELTYKQMNALMFMIEE